MKTRTHALVTTLLLALTVRLAAAQSVDEIVERHLAVSGGRAALEQLTSRVVTGTITVTTPAGDLSGPVQIFNAKPGKARTLIKLDLSALGGGTLTVDRRFDGTAGYVLDTMQGSRDVNGLELQNMRNDAYGFPEFLLAYKEDGVSLTLRGKEKVGERDAYVLIATPKNGSSVRMYIDAESFLTFRVVSMAEAPQVGQFEQTTELIDYRSVDGVKVPFQIRSRSAAQDFVITISSVEHNVKVNPSIFATPAK